MIAHRDALLPVDQIRSIDTRYVVGDLVDHLTRVDLALARSLGPSNR